MSDHDPIDITDDVLNRLRQLEPHLVARAEAEIREAYLRQLAEDLEAKLADATTSEDDEETAGD